MFNKWKKVDEVPPIVDEIDCFQDPLIQQPIPQSLGMVQIFIDFSQLGLNEIKAEIVQRDHLIYDQLKQMVVKYLAIDTKNLKITQGDFDVQKDDRFSNIKNNTIFKITQYINKQQNLINLSILWRQRNREYHIECDQDIQISELLKDFKGYLHITTHDIYIYFNGIQMNHSLKLSEYKLQKYATLELVERVTGGCFPGFAPIKLPNQTTKSISEISLGDKVLCFDFQQNQFKQSSVVKKYISQKKQRLIEIILKYGRIVCTPNHPVYTETGWKAFQPSSLFSNEPLSINDSVFDFKGNFIKISQINYLMEEEIVYNITTEYPNNYIAFEYLVHNMNKIIVLINDEREEFEILPHMLVQNLKKMIELKTGIYWQDQILLENGIEMLDTNSLEDYQFGRKELNPIKMINKNQFQQQIMQNQNQIENDKQILDSSSSSSQSVKTKNSPKQLTMINQETRKISIISQNEQHQLTIKKDTNLDQLKELLLIFEKKENLSTQLILYNGKPQSIFNEKNEEIESVFLISNALGGTQLKFYFEINNQQIQNLSELKESLQWLGISDINEFIETNLEDINSCQQKNTFQNQINIENLIAVRLYTSNLIYRKLNCDLRLSKYQGWKNFLNCLLGGLRQMNYYRGLAYRGVKNYRDTTIYQKGKIIQWCEVTSISQSQDVAKRFSNAQGMIFEIQLISAKDIAKFSLFSSEQELLMYPFSTFQIEDIQEEYNQPTRIIMKELPLPRSDYIVLWVDDNPENNYQLAQQIEQEICNISIIFCISTIDAINIIQKYKWLIFLAKSQFRVVSDMVRVEQGKMNYSAGIELMHHLYKVLKFKNPSMIFCKDVKKAKEECLKQKIQGNFSITMAVSELIKFLKFQ